MRPPGAVLQSFEIGRKRGDGAVGSVGGRGEVDAATVGRRVVRFGERWGRRGIAQRRVESGDIGERERVLRGTVSKE